MESRIINKGGVEESGQMMFRSLCDSGEPKSGLARAPGGRLQFRNMSFCTSGGIQSMELRRLFSPLSSFLFSSSRSLIERIPGTPGRSKKAIYENWIRSDFIMPQHITVVNYDSEWPLKYVRERDYITER